MNAVVTWAVLTTQFFAPTALCAASFPPIPVGDYRRIFPSSVAIETATAASVPFEIKIRRENAVRGTTPCALNAESITTTSTTRLRRPRDPPAIIVHYQHLQIRAASRMVFPTLDPTRAIARHSESDSCSFHRACHRCRRISVLARRITPCYLGSLDTSGPRAHLSSSSSSSSYYYYFYSEIAVRVGGRT